MCARARGGLAEERKQGSFLFFRIISHDYYCKLQAESEFEVREAER